MTKIDWTDGVEVELKDMLDARERRVLRREDALAHYRQPTISFSVVMPGPIKQCSLTEVIAKEAEKALRDKLDQIGWDYSVLRARSDNTGPESLYAVACGARDLKRAMVELEEDHALGRLWDLDVHGADGKGLSRRDLELPPRRCLICNDAAHACSRSRRHALDEIRAVMEKTVRSFLKK